MTFAPDGQIHVQGNCANAQTIACLEMAKHMVLLQEVGTPHQIPAGDRASIVQAPLQGRTVGK